MRETGILERGGKDDDKTEKASQKRYAVSVQIKLLISIIKINKASAYITERGKILPRRIAGLVQPIRALTKAMKRARSLLCCVYS